MDHTKPVFWTRTETAKYLSVSYRTMEHWAARGEGPPFYRLVGQAKYRPEEVEAWLEAQRVETS